MSTLDAFFDHGMVVYKPETDHLRTKNEFQRAMMEPFNDDRVDENGRVLPPSPEKMIRALSIKWFVWQASIPYLRIERAPNAMRATKKSIGKWCETAGRADLAAKYMLEADEDFENFKLHDPISSDPMHHSPEFEEDAKMEEDSVASGVSSGRATPGSLETLGDQELPGSSESTRTSSGSELDVSSDDQALPQELGSKDRPSIIAPTAETLHGGYSVFLLSDEENWSSGSADL